MREDSIPAVRRVQDAPAVNAIDNILAILRAGLGTAPFCGGLASLLTDYIPSTRIRRLEDFANELAADLHRAQNRVNSSALHTDEFAHIFEHAIRGAAENYQKEKLDAFRAIIVNAATGFQASADEQEYYLGLVSSLTVLHMKVLWFLADPERYLAQNDIPASVISGGFSDFIPRAIPEVPLEVIKSAFGDLHQHGLINSDKGIFTLMTVAGGRDLLGQRTTALGRSFVAFCSTPPEAADA